MVRLLIAVAVSAALAGCSSLGFSGLAGSRTELNCKAPDGVLCSSVSGTYANSVAGTLPGQLPTKAGEAKAEAGLIPVAALPVVSPADMATPTSGDPVRVAPRVLRVWIAPWEDSDGDLHDQHYIYTVVQKGKWAIETTQDAITSQYRPVFPLKGVNAPPRDGVQGDNVQVDEGFGTPAGRTGAVQ